MLSKLSALSDPRRLLPIIIVIAFLLRIPGIFWGLPIIDKYAHLYHPDEPKIIRGAMAFPEDIFENKDLRYPTGLHYFIGTIVLPLDALTASSQLSDSQFQNLTFVIARLISIAHGLAAVMLVYMFGKKYYNTNTGLLAAALLSVSLYHARHSAIATTDVATSFWIMVVLTMLYRFSPRSSYRDYIVLGALTGLLTGIKYSGAIVVVSIGIVLLKVLSEAQGRNQKQKIIIGGLISAPTAIFAFLITTPTILVNPNAFRESMAVLSIFVGGQRVPFWNIQPLFAGYNFLVDAVGLPLALLTLFGIVFALRKSEWYFSLPLVLMTVVYILYFWGSMFPRYYILILPILSLLAARGAASFVNSRNYYLKLGMLTALAITIFYSIIYTIAGTVLLLDDTRSEASAYIQANIPAGATVGYWYIGTTFRGGWELPFVDPEIYRFADNLDHPEYVILTSQSYLRFERALSSDDLSADYVWDPQFAFAWYMGRIPAPEVFEFYDYFLNGIGEKYNYELIEVFDPLNINVPIEFPPPEIRIYRRIDP